MSDRQYQTVVQGEASESEEEEELVNEPISVVVEGEAEETDEEELDTSRPGGKKDLPPLRLNEYSTFEALDDMSEVPSFPSRRTSKPRHDTVLNKKLWDSNLSLCSNLNGLVSQTYLTAAKDIVNCSHQVSKSHSLIQDVSHNMRLMTNDLFNLHDHIDIVTSCTILPTISIERRPRTPSALPQTPTSPPVETDAVAAKQ